MSKLILPAFSLKEFLTFSVKWYQLNYFICIKDFNAQTITSWKLNLFSFLLTAVIVHTWIMKEKDPSWYISVIRQTMGYQTPVFTHLFSWRLHIYIKKKPPPTRLHVIALWKCLNPTLITALIAIITYLLIEIKCLVRVTALGWILFGMRKSKTVWYYHKIKNNWKCPN
jgi:hypothetical protein